MENLIEEIRMQFASHIQGMRPLKKLPIEYIAYTFRNGVEYGVAIEADVKKEIYEEAAQITLKTFRNLGKQYIALSSCDEAFRNEFAKFGASFVTPGINGDNRQKLLSSPVAWWNGWIGMLGNRVGSKNSYDIIAEMMALKDLFSKDNSIQWTASHAGSHDIESPTNSYEVKSTIKKSETNVTISSRFQLDSEKPLELWFYRMEESEQGFSINDMKNELVKCGYSESTLEAQLQSKGFILGNSIRDRKYIVLERRKYTIDESFPRIVESSFKNNVYPKNIIKILYTIDLEGLDYSI